MGERWMYLWKIGLSVKQTSLGFILTLLLLLPQTPTQPNPTQGK